MDKPKSADTIFIRRTKQSPQTKARAMLNAEIQRVLRETSPAELAVMQDLDNWRAWETATWLIEHILTGHTESQAEAMAYRLLETVRKGN